MMTVYLFFVIVGVLFVPEGMVKMVASINNTMNSDMSGGFMFLLGIVIIWALSLVIKKV